MTLEEEWSRCRPWIVAALPYCYGTHTIDDVWDAIVNGEAQFWPGKQCAVVTEIIRHPRLSELNLWLIGGDWKDLTEQMEPAICAWAKANGCARIIGYGRLGEIKTALKEYQRRQIVLMKDLTSHG